MTTLQYVQPTDEQKVTKPMKIIEKYREWLSKPRPGLPPMPQDYIDSQIEAVELFAMWKAGEDL